jgi:hypothetical protein
MQAREGSREHLARVEALIARIPSFVEVLERINAIEQRRLQEREEREQERDDVDDGDGISDGERWAETMGEFAPATRICIDSTG